MELAAAFLGRCNKPKRVGEITEAVLAAGWKTGGKTPRATINAAIIREIREKGKSGRFKKAGRGLFAAGRGA